MDSKREGVYGGKRRVKEAGCPFSKGCHISGIPRLCQADKFIAPVPVICQMPMCLLSSSSSRVSIDSCFDLRVPADTMYLDAGFRGCEEHHREGTTRSAG